MSIALSVNLNKIALLRNARGGEQPSVLAFAERSLSLGCAGITVHPRPDQRHIRADDVLPCKTIVETFPGTEFNVEGNPFAEPSGGYPGFMTLVEASRPHQCTLVPDAHGQLTSDHGFDLFRDGEKLRPIIEQLHDWGCRVSLFMDPVIEQITLAKQIRADRIELYTGPYAEAFAQSEAQGQLDFDKYEKAAKHADAMGLGINAGHDLNLDNLPLFATLPHLKEVSIGHALTVDALLMGYDNAIQAYLTLCH